jgi:hypothetical protein
MAIRSLSFIRSTQASRASRLSITCQRRSSAGTVGGIVGARRLRSQLRQPGIELEIAKQRLQRRLVRGLGRQVADVQVQVDVALDAGQLPRQGQLLERGAQVFAELAGKLVGSRHDGIQAAALVQPLGRRLRSDLGDAGYVVHAVTHQRQVGR